ncbi:MAG: AraC family transcriptional regulator ligand-binding domain-containing protein [Burkholderiales bacterium]|nr:AraC family transcriptional regulator ligand-binding domain-containing protein [Burkholderiales bacterium]
MTTPQTVIATWLLGVAAQFERLGIDLGELGAGLGPLTRGLTAPTRQLQLVQVRRLWQRAAAVSGDPLLGLRVGAGLPLQAMHVLTLVVMHSARLRDALGCCVRYQQLVSNSGRFRLVAVPGGTRMVYKITPCPVPMHPAQVDSLFAGLLTTLYRCVPDGQRPSAVGLPGTDATLRTVYAQRLECPVVLGGPDIFMQFDDAVLDAPWPAADPGLLRLLLGRADAMRQAQGRTDALVDQVNAAVAAEGYAQARCETVARSLELSVRTLQRRLADCDTSFRQVVEAARMGEAVGLLADASVPLSALAERLGYAEPSAFSHAVRAHFGVSPRALRADMANSTAEPG